MQLVFVRGVGGEMRRLALLEVAPPIAYVCLVEDFEATVSGAKARPLIGYRLENVFETGGMEGDRLIWSDALAQHLRPITP